MKCPKCKAVIKDNVNGCPECGYKEVEDLSGINIGKLSKLGDKKIDSLPDGYPRHYYHHDGKRGLFAILALYKNIFSYSGVSDWIEYWTQSVFVMLIAILHLEIRDQMILSNLNPSSTLITLYYVTLGLFLLTLLAYYPAKVRRLRDAGFSPFFILFPGVNDILTLLKYNRNGHNRFYEKQPDIKVKLEKTA